jgi:hypothetical protein
MKNKPKTTTITLKIEEDLGGYIVSALSKRGEMSPDQQELAACFLGSTPERFIPDDGEEPTPQNLYNRISMIAERNNARMHKIENSLSVKIRRTAYPPKPKYEFPTLRGCDQTKWGPTDFYDDTKEWIAQAFESGLDFETPWLSCKKEILSSQILRENKKITIKVSVSDDFDTPGMGESSFRITSKTTPEEFFDLLDAASGKAHTEAIQDQNCNACYIGYSVGPVDSEGKFKWVLTYLASNGGFDVPTGDYYHRFGWQEVETDDPYDDSALPPEEEIPAEVAKEIARRITRDYPKSITYKGFKAKQWE